MIWEGKERLPCSWGWFMCLSPRPPTQAVGTGRVWLGLCWESSAHLSNLYPLHKMRSWHALHLVLQKNFRPDCAPSWCWDQACEPEQAWPSRMPPERGLRGPRNGCTVLVHGGCWWGEPCPVLPAWAYGSSVLTSTVAPPLCTLGVTVALVSHLLALSLNVTSESFLLVRC